MSRFVVTACVLVSVAACDRPPGARCFVDQLDVIFPATIQRDSGATREELYATVSPAEISPESFDSLAGTLVRGEPMSPAVLWSVPAFNTSPGGISFVHAGTVRRGETLRIAGIQDGGGWGVMPSVPRDSALAGVEAGEFAARAASGTIAVLETEPLALRIDLTAWDSVGETLHVRGDARFTLRRERGRCPERG